MKDNWSGAFLHFLCIILSNFNSCELFQQGQTTEATIKPISRGQTTKQPSEETTEGTTNKVTYQNTVVSEKISALNFHQKPTAVTTTIPITKGQTTKQPSSDFSPQLLLTDSKNIIILDTATWNETIVAEGYNYVLFLAYHQSKDFIFWSDYVGGTISRINYPSIDKTPAEVIIIGSYPSGIAVDSINDHLYWTDIGRGSIFRSNIDGLNTITILNNIYSLVIELDIRNGWLYFEGYGIEKCRVDGTDRQTVVREISCNSIMLDLKEGRLYWTDVSIYKIRSALLNGSDITTVYDISPLHYYLMGLDISDSHIYFTVLNTGKLYATPRYDQNAVKELLYSSNSYMMNVKIYKFSGCAYTSNYLSYFLSLSCMSNSKNNPVR